MIYYTVDYRLYTILYYTILYYTILYYTILYTRSRPRIPCGSLSGSCSATLPARIAPKGLHRPPTTLYYVPVYGTYSYTIYYDIYYTTCNTMYTLIYYILHKLHDAYDWHYSQHTAMLSSSMSSSSIARVACVHSILSFVPRAGRSFVYLVFVARPGEARRSQSGRAAANVPRAAREPPATRRLR